MKAQSILFGLAAVLSTTPVLAKTTSTPTTASAAPTATGPLSNKPSEEPHIGQITNQGCFNSSLGLTLENENLEFNTDGACGAVCQKKQNNVGATRGGQECWCGDEYPPMVNLVADSECNFPCTGFRDIACGGLDTWSVYNTGVKLAVHNHDPEEATTTTPGQSSQTSAASDTETSQPSGSGGNSKTVGIAVGVVVALLIVGGTVGGIFWYLRKKRNQEIEEEHRRNAAVNAFINGSNPPGSSHGSISMTDSRLDPVMVHRRLSDGSIADNQDYSRKILRVTNA